MFCRSRAKHSCEPGWQCPGGSALGGSAQVAVLVPQTRSRTSHKLLQGKGEGDLWGGYGSLRWLRLRW